MLTKEEVLKWLRSEDEKLLEKLWFKADLVRKENVGDDIHLRALLEVSNICVRSCAYCGISVLNNKIARYQLTKEEILDSAYNAHLLGYQTVVMQAGETPNLSKDFIKEVIKEIKLKTDMAITLSLGERDEEELLSWREAGADRYLLRFETSNDKLFKAIHPPYKDKTVDRIERLKAIKQMGYETGSGVMVGIPGQTYEDLANDILMFHELDLDMIGIGPYLRHPDTPLGQDFKTYKDQVPNNELMVYKTLALTRIIRPKANLPSTTALATMNSVNGRELGLSRGANILMPNITPSKYRQMYQLYPGKACITESPEDTSQRMKNKIESIGRTIGQTKGSSLNYKGSKMNKFPTLTLSKNAKDFIDEQYIEGLLKLKADPARVKEIIEKSLQKEPLSVEETAQLILADDKESVAAILKAAKTLKERVYGNRIVLFAPLYIGSKCINDCTYCAFKRSNIHAIRRTLTEDEIVSQVTELENKGHKRLILVFGEHQAYDAKFIADSVKTVYQTKNGHGEIRRVNINAAPLDVEGYKIVKEAGIGTYQIFHETYHHETYAKMHPKNTRKGDYLYRLDGLNRAFEAGCDDVGLGVLFGLYDWRFELLSLVIHSLFLQQTYGVGPHTISFPRIRPASGVEIDDKYLVKDEDFKKIIAILRLAVPYTGLILTARENAEIRKECLSYGVSQIDAGSRIELGGYTEAGEAQVIEKEQFQLADVRTLDEVMGELLEDGYLPSFCTSCYRAGRTGEHFMEFTIPGFIKKFCTPNAILTLQEYLEDYASGETKQKGIKLIEDEISKLDDAKKKTALSEMLENIKAGKKRDYYF